jgi:hypothetical protein
VAAFPRAPYSPLGLPQELARKRSPGSLFKQMRREIGYVQIRPQTVPKRLRRAEAESSPGANEPFRCRRRIRSGRARVCDRGFWTNTPSPHPRADAADRLGALKRFRPLAAGLRRASAPAGGAAVSPESEVCTARAFAASPANLTHGAMRPSACRDAASGPAWIRTRDQRIMSPLL